MGPTAKRGGRIPFPAVPGIRGVVSDLVAGWRFLRGEPVLLANTLQAVVAQFSTGVTIGVMAIYALEAISLSFA